MFRGDRGAFFAIGIVAGVAIAIILSFPELHNPSTYHNQQIASEQTGEHASHNKKTDEPQWWDWTRRFIAAEDTLAQWIMAFFSIAAVLLIWRTLQQTNKTNHAAVEAAKAANEANEIMRGQLRPWIHFEISPIGTFEFFEGSATEEFVNRVGYSIETKLINSGNEPATNVSFHTHIFKSKPIGCERFIQEYINKYSATGKFPSTLIIRPNSEKDFPVESGEWVREYQNPILTGQIGQSPDFFLIALVTYGSPTSNNLRCFGEGYQVEIIEGKDSKTSNWKLHRLNFTQKIN